MCVHTGGKDVLVGLVHNVFWTEPKGTGILYAHVRYVTTPVVHSCFHWSLPCLHIPQLLPSFLALSWAMWHGHCSQGKQQNIC